MTQGADSGLKPARPSIAIADRDEPALAQGLLDLLIVETSAGLYRCEARFGNWGERDGGAGFLYFDGAKLDFGKRLQVKLGDQAIFDGRVTGLEAMFPEGAPPAITVLAEDRLQDLRMTRRTRSFPDTTDADVLQSIARAHGLDADVSVSGPTHKVLAQLNQSDLAFARERARAIGAEVWVEGTTLKARARADRGGGAPVRLAYGKELHELTALADLSGQRSRVLVSGWSVANKEEISREAGPSAVSGELGDDEAGAEILDRALGARAEALVHRAPIDAEDARAQAEAHYAAMARRFVVVRGRAAADARLRVGATVELTELGDRFSGKYYLAEVRHVFDAAKGLYTELVGERPGLGRAR